VIVPYGRTGNNILEHMLAIYIQSHVPDVKIFCNSNMFLDIFHLLVEKEPLSSQQDRVCNKIIIDRNGYNLGDIISTIKRSENIKVIISYCVFDKKHYTTILHSYRLLYNNKICND